MKFALHLALLFLAFTFPARAHDIEYDTGAICDTQNQAQRLAMLLDDDEHAIAMVNAEEGNPSACAVETVAFVRGASLATVRTKADAFAVIEILVVGVDLESGFPRSRSMSATHSGVNHKQTHKPEGAPGRSDRSASPGYH